LISVWHLGSLEFRKLWRQGCDVVVSLLVATEFMKKFGIVWKIFKNEYLVKDKSNGF